MLVASKVQIVETCGYLGNPVIIGSDLVEKDYINISQEKLWGYELDNQNENTELQIARLCRLLEDINWSKPSLLGGQIDGRLKIDVLLKQHSEKNYLGFQVKVGKSGKDLAERFYKKEQKGVFWVNDRTFNPLIVLCRLSKFLDILIRKDVIQVIQTWKYQRGRRLPITIFNFSKGQIEAGLLLKIVKIEGRDIAFL